MRLYFYELKNLLRSKDVMFWTMAFPLILGTLFFVSFGTAHMEVNFENIPIAVVSEEETSGQIFDVVLKQVAISGDAKDIGYEEKEEVPADENDGLKELAESAMADGMIGIDGMNGIDGMDGAEVPNFFDPGMLDVEDQEVSKEDALFTNYNLSKEDAEKALKDEDIKAIILVEGEDKIEVVVKKSSIAASIVECFVNRYLAQYDQFMEVLENHPEQLEGMVASLKNEVTDNQITIKNQEENTDDYNPFINYFYALIAMTCMFGSMFSQKSIEELQADQSPLGARRNIAPTSKTVLLFADILAAMTVHFAEILIAMFYLIKILGVNFGDNVPYILLAAVVGCFVGISFGMFVGTVFKCDSNKKGGIITCVSLACCFFSGLMYGDMLHVVEIYAPWFNRINPAALLVNAFHSLVIYDTMHMYYTNVITLVGIGLAMDIVSIIVIRRKRYANI